MTANMALPYHHRVIRNPTFHVLVAILLGGLTGVFSPELGVALKPLGDGFIKMIKMIIGPIIFLTIVTGIAHVGDVKKVGKIGGKAIIYFEIVTTLALILGMLAMNIFQPGVGFDTEHGTKGDISKFTAAAATNKEHSTAEFILNIIPDNIIGAFANGDLLQVLFVSVMFGMALSAMGEKGQTIIASFERYSALIFKVMGIVMKFAPLGAYGAMAFTIGKFGLASAIPLLKLLLVACATMIFFIFVVLGSIATYYRFSVWKFIRYIKDELIIVLGTGSSEPVLPVMLEKMQRLGCAKPVVGLVLPTGYSFNLDGSSIYLAMCVLFIAQAYNIHLDISQQISILGILLLTSKGAAGVVGSAFIVLAATITATRILPIEGLALLLGIDRFMSSVRAMINLIGNGVATIVIAKTERAFDEAQALEEYREYFGEPELRRI